MKTFTINIHPSLKNVTFSVQNGRKFVDDLVSGRAANHLITPDVESLERIKRVAIKYGNDYSSNRGNWYAHCNGYAMDLCVSNKGAEVTINTYRPFGAARK